MWTVGVDCPVHEGAPRLRQTVRGGDRLVEGVDVIKAILATSLAAAAVLALSGCGDRYDPRFPLVEVAGQALIPTDL